MVTWMSFSSIRINLTHHHYTGEKSDLLLYLEDVTGVSSSPAVQVSILDGSAVVNMLQPGTV